MSQEEVQHQKFPREQLTPAVTALECCQSTGKFSHPQFLTPALRSWEFCSPFNHCHRNTGLRSLAAWRWWNLPTSTSPGGDDLHRDSSTHSEDDEAAVSHSSSKASLQPANPSLPGWRGMQSSGLPHSNTAGRQSKEKKRLMRY